ncbi:MAG: hypothetical protein GX061_09090 [Eubacteriaceae bacterium]|nr:hypothetical protein [Eubacteriaceae bacterium]
MQREFANCRFEFPPETAEALGAYKEKLTQRKSELEKRIVKIDSLMARLDEKITDLASRGQEETLTIE